MIEASDFCALLSRHNLDFFTGIPDSLLKNFCSYLESNCNPSNYIIASNEGNAISIGIGYHLATKRIPVCFLQNSGLGNLINPITSLANKNIYSIPSLLIIGWRGEPGVKDEPQHIFQGEITERQLELLGISYLIVDCNTQLSDLEIWLNNKLKDPHGPMALIIRKGTFRDASYSPNCKYPDAMTRESALRKITELSKNTPIVSTTGKTSRELYEIRNSSNSHHLDFLTVGGMGHTSSIALGIALAKPDKTIICIDGDGSLIMHMGALAIMAEKNPKNLKYILLNNSAHESVGGQPTIASTIDFRKICDGLSINRYYAAKTVNQIQAIWKSFYDECNFSFLEIKIKTGSRKDLGRPKTSPSQNKEAFMEYLLND